MVGNTYRWSLGHVPNKEKILVTEGWENGSISKGLAFHVGGPESASQDVHNNAEYGDAHL